MAKKLFVGGLAWATTDASLNDFFSQIGQVLSANVVTDKMTGRSRGFGFVEMASDEDAEKAKQELNGKELDGRAIMVSDARPQEERSSTGGGNFSRSGGFDRRDNNRGGGGNRDGNRRRY